MTVEYTFVESPKHDHTCIGIKSGRFAGVIYKYGKIIPKEENDKLTLQFEFDIIENNGIPRHQFKDEFFDIIGDILTKLIDEHGTNNTTEPHWE